MIALGYWKYKWKNDAAFHTDTDIYYQYTKHVLYLKFILRFLLKLIN